MSICLVFNLTACPCERVWKHIGIDAELVVPNTYFVNENVYSLGGESMSWFRDELVNNAYNLISQFINLN
jgi:excinuclease ABC subunit A